MRFEARRFLVEHFGTPQGVVSYLRAYGVVPPGVTTVEKWFQRASIPSEWFPLLLACLELDRGGPVSVSKYLGGV